MTIISHFFIPSSSGVLYRELKNSIQETISKGLFSLDEAAASQQVWKVKEGGRLRGGREDGREGGWEGGSEIDRGGGRMGGEREDGRGEGGRLRGEDGKEGGWEGRGGRMGGEGRKMGGREIERGGWEGGRINITIQIVTIESESLCPLIGFQK